MRSLFGWNDTFVHFWGTYSLSTSSCGLGWTDPHCPLVKTLKLAIYLFLEFWLQMGFNSIILVHILLNFLLERTKIGAGFCLHSRQWRQWESQSSPSIVVWQFEMECLSQDHCLTYTLFKYSSTVNTRFIVLIYKVEAPIQLRSNPFPHSMKPPKVESMVFQKWVAWVLLTTHCQEESISTAVIAGHH
jgi:hypothetical protein